MARENPRRSALLRYGVSFLSIGAGLALRYSLRITGHEVPFLTFFPAILVSSWYGGLGPGLCATGLGAVASWFAIFSHGGSNGGPSSALLLALYLLVGAAISALNEANARSRRRAVVKAEEADAAWREQDRWAATLRRSEERYRSLISAATAILWTTDRDGDFVEPQPSWSAYTGQTWDECRGSGWVAAICPEDREAVRQAWYAAAARREAYDFESRHWHAATGEYRWVLVKAAPILDSEGSVTEWIGACIDVHERRAMERRINELNAALQSRLAELEAIFDVMPIGIGISRDPECREIRMNPVFNRLLRVPIGANPSKTGPDAGLLPFRVLRNGKEIPGHMLPMQRAARDGVSVSSEEIDITFEDGAVHLLCSASPLFDAAGRPAGCVGVFTDVSESRLAEASLRASEERYRSLVQVSSSIVCITAPNGEFSERQVSWENYTGQSWAQSRGFGWLDSLYPDDRARLRKDQALCALEDRSYELECRVWNERTNSYRWSVARIVPVHEPDGQIREWIATVQDVHDRKLSEESLRQKQKLESIGLLAGGVAHDFNNLLTGILGGASVLAETLPEDNDSRFTLDLIVRASERAAHLTRQLLAYAGKSFVAPQRLDLSQLVDDTVKLISSSIPAYVSVTVTHSEPLFIVNDPGETQQVVMNLILNAAESIHEGRPGKISVRTWSRAVKAQDVSDMFSGTFLPAGQYSVLEVADTGCGMDPETQARIFDPFFTTKFQGRGLGLAAVQGILRSSGGGIELNSSAGIGSRFTVYLPAAAAAETAEPTADCRQLSHWRILVVDDEEPVRAALSLMLRNAGHAPQFAEDGLAAVRRLTRDRAGIDLVLLDLGLPGMSGMETLRRLREIRPDLPVIVITGYGERDALSSASHAKVPIVYKPFVASTLLSAIDSLAAESAITRAGAH